MTDLRSTARRDILGQHQRIRVLLEAARKLAEDALDGDSAARGRIAAAIADVRTTMERHLAFEEVVLLPILRDESRRGWRRAEQLLNEHTRQRATLAALQSDADAHPELPELAAKLVSLAETLLADMAEEEASLPTARVARDDVVVPENDGQ
jgi:iron-sulfur cluster repair protein YtfE (RIC family)